MQEGNMKKDYAFDLDDLALPKSRSRFRFKTKNDSDDATADIGGARSKKRSRADSRDVNDRRERRRHGHHRHSNRSSKAQKRTKGGVVDDDDEHDDASAYRSSTNPTYEMDAETAFRESLFDAMADDEGAAFWEGVYGQPIHNYPKSRPTDPSDPAAELQEMSDEEYTAYVRQQMWEKTHQHVIEERKRREETAQRRKQDAKRTRVMEDERDAFNRKMEESLRRGVERRKDRLWRDGWATYLGKWDKLLSLSKPVQSSTNSIDSLDKGMIPWPNRSGQQANINKEEVEAFFEHAANRDLSKRNSLRSLLKSERVRWHPDKMQQRFGTRKLDVETLKTVTAVFQIIDDMWAKTSS